ncbi:MAG: hypothetical protein ACPIOQ_64480, partial [Promethearchaeia archaeon]
MVPKSKKLAQDWQELYKKGAKQRIVWKPYTDNSIPQDDADAKWAYDALRIVIQKGDALCHETVVTHGIQQTQKAMRGGSAGEQEEVEYEVVGLARPDGAPIEPVGVSTSHAPAETSVSMSTAGAHDDGVSSDRGNKCQACRRRLDQCVCQKASSQATADANTGADAPARDVWNEEPDWTSLPRPPKPTMPFRILFVGATNSDEVKLSVEKELETIFAAFTSEWGHQAWRSCVTFEYAFFTDMEGLVQRLLDFRPTIVHFVCHGEESFLSLYQGTVSVQTLAEAFAAWSNDAIGGALRLVVGNVCNSAQLAKVLSEHVDFVIGHHQPVLDSAAVKFARALYKNLGSGCSLLTSFNLAKAVEGCGMYCLRGRKDANQFAFVKPT